MARTAIVAMKNNVIPPSKTWEWSPKKPKDALKNWLGANGFPDTKVYSSPQKDKAIAHIKDEAGCLVKIMAVR